MLLQSGDPETLRLWQLLVDLSMQHFNRLYRKLGVLLTDDDLAGESMYNDLLPEVVERLRTAGLLEESDGAEVVFPPGYTNREGEPLPLIVQKRGRRVQLRHQRPGLRARPRRTGQGDAPAVRRRRAAGAAPGDGVRRRRDGRLAATAGAGRARRLRHSCSAPTARC